MSAEFWLYPAGVVEQATVFTAYGELAAGVRDWVTGIDLSDAPEHPAYSGGAGPAIEIRQGLIDWFDHLEKVLLGVGAELNEVAAEGERIDLEQQAELDHVDPQTYEGYDQTYYGTGGLVPESEQYQESLPVWLPKPQGATAYLDYGPGWQNLNNLSASIIPDDILSPSELVWSLLGFLGAQDLSEMVMKTFGGYWGDLVRFTDTLTGLCELMTEMYTNLQLAKDYLPVVWQGVAATSAQKYLTDLLSAISTAETTIAETQQAFSTYTAGVVQQSEAIAGLLFKLGDTLIFAAGAAAFGTATIESLIGGIAGYGTAGAAILYAGYQVYEIRGIIQDVELAYTVVTSLANAHVSLADFTSDVPVPQMVEAS